jgi:acyl-CoA reductase-like NAD-dependent aldehyde dehydrogenase
MRLIPAAGLTFFAGCFALVHAQGAPSAAAGCPVVFHAQYLADGSVVKTADTAQKEHPLGVGQWFHLTLASSGANRITQAAVRVYGLTGKGRLMQAQSSDAGSPEATQDEVVHFKPISDTEIAADVWATGMTSVAGVHVMSLTYANGETRQLSDGDACHVTMDLLMPVGGR